MKTPSGGNMPAIITAVLKGDLADVRSHAAEDGNIEARDRDGRSAIHHAAIDGNLELVDLLVELGADVNASDREGWTPLHFAAQEWREDIARKLIESGARVDAVDVYGNTPLMRAVFCSKGRPELIRLLVSAAADKDRKNHSGVSARDLAKTIANYDIEPLLEDQ